MSKRAKLVAASASLLMLVVVAACSSSSTTTETGAPGTTSPTVTIPAAYQGTWTRRFVPVGCAIELRRQPTTPPSTTRSAWNQPPATCDDNKGGAPLYYVGTVTLSANTVDVTLPTTKQQCTAKVAKVQPTSDGVRLDLTGATCGGVPAPDVQTTLRLDGTNTLIADGQDGATSFQRKGSGTDGAPPGSQFVPVGPAAGD